MACMMRVVGRFKKDELYCLTSYWENSMILKVIVGLDLNQAHEFDDDDPLQF